MEQNTEVSDNQLAPLKQIDTTVKKLKYLLIVLVAVIVIEIIAIIIVPLVKSGNNNGGGSSSGGNSAAGNSDSGEVRSANTMDEIVAYCKEKKLFPTGDVDYGTEHVTDSIECDDMDNATLFMHFTIFDQPFMELFNINDLSGITVLESTENYAKLYGLYNGMFPEYVVISDNTLLIIFGAEDAVRQALIDLGWPDRNWASGSETNSNTYNEKAENSMSNNSERLNIISDVSTSLTMYQANNRSKLPEGPYYWSSSDGTDCKDEKNTACIFIDTYLYAQEIDDFVDPDGSQFGFYYTDNLHDNDEISLTFGNNNSYLVNMGDEYTIGGDSPFGEHIIYMIPGGRCNSNEDGVVRGNTARSHAVMYMLENGSVVCRGD